MSSNNDIQCLYDIQFLFLLEFAFVTYFIEKYWRHYSQFFLSSSIWITYAIEMTQQSNYAKEKGVDVTIGSEQNYK